MAITYLGAAKSKIPLKLGGYRKGFTNQAAVVPVVSFRFSVPASKPIASTLRSTLKGAESVTTVYR